MHFFVFFVVYICVVFRTWPAPLEWSAPALHTIVVEQGLDLQLGLFAFFVFCLHLFCFSHMACAFSTHTGRLGRSSVHAFRAETLAEHLLGAIPGGWAWRRVGPTGAPPGCLQGELWGCISFTGFYARIWSGLATRADVCKSLGFLLANGPGGARLPTFGYIYIYGSVPLMLDGIWHNK